MDFQAVYDSFSREVLYNVLGEFGIPKKLVGLIKLCMHEVSNRVHKGKYLSDAFLVHSGLNQGDALSPFLFNMPVGKWKRIRMAWK
jgi:hypothetical protein